MIFYLLFCNILFIPIDSSSTTVSEPNLSNVTPSESHMINQSNETKVTLLSEGGSLLPGSVLALPKEKLTNLDSELGKSKVKPVVARKGVVYIEDDNIKSQQKNVSINNLSSTDATNIQEKISVSMKNVTNSTNKTNLLNKFTVGNKDVKSPKLLKKPLLLSYDTLANMTVKSSPNLSLNDQVQSSNKAYTKNANSHPGMIMPLVITILLVPMFAVLGYMALRRGQEAWKNRHYKRMDFLLDGMYND